MEACLLRQDNFKEQLLEFIEDREKPFDVEFLMKHCLQPVSDIKIHDVLCELAEEGKIIRLDDRYYLSTRVLIRNLEGNVIFDEIELPQRLIRQVAKLIKEKPELGYIDIADFVRDAIRRYLLHSQR